MAPRMGSEQVRQGRKGTPVLRILVIAMILAVLAGLGMWLFASGTHETLPDANTGAGLTAPTPDTGAGTGTAAPGASTVTPQNSTTGSGN